MGNTNTHNEHHQQERLSLNSSYSIITKPTSPDTKSRTSIIASSSSSNSSSPVSPKKSSFTSFTPQYHIEHSVRIDTDNLTSLSVCYNLGTSDRIQSCHINSPILPCDNDLFHIHSVAIPVSLYNCAFVMKYVESQCNQQQQKELLADSVDKRGSSGLYEDEFVEMTCNELVLKQFQAPTMSSRRIAYKDIIQFDWISTDSLRGKFILGVSLLQHEFGARILQTNKQKDNKVSTGFLITEKDKALPIFITTQNTRLFFEQISEVLIDLGTPTRNTITSVTLR
jgi:hypothetical protein